MSVNVGRERKAIVPGDWLLPSTGLLESQARYCLIGVSKRTLSTTSLSVKPDPTQTNGYVGRLGTPLPLIPGHITTSVYDTNWDAGTALCTWYVKAVALPEVLAIQRDLQFLTGSLLHNQFALLPGRCLWWWASKQVLTMLYPNQVLCPHAGVYGCVQASGCFESVDNHVPQLVSYDMQNLCLHDLTPAPLKPSTKLSMLHQDAAPMMS